MNDIELDDMDRTYWEAHRALRLIYGDIVPEDYHEFIVWIDRAVHMSQTMDTKQKPF